MELQGDTIIYIIPSKRLGLFLSIHPLHSVAGRYNGVFL